jgi:hypothetical protein
MRSQTSVVLEFQDAAGRVEVVAVLRIETGRIGLQCGELFDLGVSMDRTV